MAQIASIAASNDRPARGIFFMILSVLLFACVDALVKWASARYPLGQIIFFRNIVAFVPIGLFIGQAGGFAALRTRRPASHLLRAVVGLLAMVCLFKAFALLKLADAVALSLSAPIFVTALSVPLLDEPVGVRRWSAVIVGFTGILIMTRPGASVFDPNSLFAVAGAMLYALVIITVRRLGRTEPAATTVFYYTLCATLASGLSLPFQWATPDLADLAGLLALGLFGGFAQMAFTQAVRLAPAALVAPFDYLALVFAVAFGYAIWGEVPDAALLVGAAVVIGSGLYILRREAALARGRSPS